jgi:hypothetical protein
MWFGFDEGCAQLAGVGAIALTDIQTGLLCTTKPKDWSLGITKWDYSI